MVYSVCLEKTGFVYADAQTVHLARLTCYTLFSLSLSLSIVKQKQPWKMMIYMK